MNKEIERYLVELVMVADNDDQALDMTVDMLPDIYFIEHIKIKKADGELVHEWELGDWEAAQRLLFTDADWAKQLKRCGNCKYFYPSDDGLAHRLDKSPGGFCANQEYIDQLYPPEHVSDNPDDDLVHDDVEVDYSDHCEYLFEPMMLCPLCGRMMFIWHGEYGSSPNYRAICYKCQIILPAIVTDDWRKLRKAADRKIKEAIKREEKLEKLLRKLR